MLDPRLLQSFVTLSDTGSFTLAAQRLNMTQSTISQQLARLEAAVGHPLIDRAARPARTTAAGERLLAYARRILALQSAAEIALRDPAGTSALRIGIPEDMAGLEMAQVFREFSRVAPQFRLDVTAGLSRDLSHRYREGELDIVIVKEAEAQPDFRACFPEAIGWFESAVGAQDWDNPVPLVAFPPGGLYRETMFSRIEQLGRRWYVAFSGSSLINVIVGTEAGLGLTLLPIRAVTGRALRPWRGFGAEAGIVVTLYAWDRTGQINELVRQMALVLERRATA